MNYMVKLILMWTVALILAASFALADVPPMINYQGRLVDSTGVPKDTTIAMVFAIYDEGGVLKWTESHREVTVSNGLFNVVLGSVDTIPNSVFSDSARYLGIQVGNDPEYSPRTQLISTPYAMVANRVSGDIETGEGSLSVKSSDDSMEVNIGNLSRGQIGLSARALLPAVRDLLTFSAEPGIENRMDIYMPGADADAGILQLGATPTAGGYISIHAAEPLLAEKVRLGGSVADTGFIQLFGGGHGTEYKLIEMKSHTNTGGCISFFDNEAPHGKVMEMGNVSANGKAPGDFSIYIFNPQPEPPGLQLAISSSPTTGASFRLFQPQPEPPGRVGIEMSVNTAKGPGGSIAVNEFSDSLSSLLTGGNLLLGEISINGGPSAELGLYSDTGQFKITGQRPPTGGQPAVIVMLANQDIAKVGIGTDSIPEALTVMGNGWFSGEVYTLTATKAKKNIQPIDNALEKVSRMNGYYYDCRTDEYPSLRMPETRQVGFLAEEVKEVVPEIVGENGYGLTGVDYSRITTLLVEAVKELKAENENLKHRIEILENR
jgi:hypothetical protein